MTRVGLLDDIIYGMSVRTKACRTNTAIKRSQCPRTMNVTFRVTVGQQISKGQLRRHAAKPRVTPVSRSMFRASLLSAFAHLFDVFRGYLLPPNSTCQRTDHRSQRCAIPCFPTPDSRHLALDAITDAPAVSADAQVTWKAQLSWDARVIYGKIDLSSSPEDKLGRVGRKSPEQFHCQNGSTTVP
jgi:hypothetical protein